MFTFNFSKQNSFDENQKKQLHKNKKELNWFLAKEIDLPKQLFENYKQLSYVLNTNFLHFPLKLVDSKKVVINLTENDCKNIIEAESQHFDLIPAKYEGGLKIWECTYDLGNYILSQQISLNDKKVLDLGCGVGIIGIIALIQGSTVHFQDYNNEVLNFVTIPNVILNFNNHNIMKERCKFYGGDWESFGNLLSSTDKNIKYDFIFTCETIYNPDNHQKLYQIFKQCLKESGIGYIAGKTYYFGVGGGMRQFEELVLKDNLFHFKIVWKSTQGLQREILQLKRKILSRVL